MTQASRAEPPPRLDWRLLLGFWAIVSVFFIARAVFTSDRVPLIEDTDDAMRLVVVRDFLAGQNWFDHTQYRLNTPFGADIHWSRLVDLPIAALILLLKPFAGGAAETLVAYIWPLSLLLVLLWLSAKLTLRLVGREGMLPAIALPVLSPAVSAEFSPGRFDHHNIQILLTILLVWSAIEAVRRPRWAIGAGIVGATALAIGTEGLPVVAATTIAFAFLHILRPTPGMLRSFGVSFAGSAVIHLAIATPPERWFTPACDALSIVYVAAAVATGIAFTVLSLLPTPQRNWPVRLLLAAGAGGLVLALIATAFPACLRGPYAALDPWLVTNWLDRIAEARSLWSSLDAAPDLTLGFIVPPLLGLLLLMVRLWKGPAEDRAAWLVLGLVLAVSVAVMIMQVRGARIATPLAVPAAAWLIAEARARYLRRGNIASILGLIAGWIAFAGVAVLLLFNFASLGWERLRGADAAEAAEMVASSRSSDACLMPSAFIDLAGLRPARVMTPIDLGSHMLLFTPHQVVAAPYHRNQKGVRDTFDFFNGHITGARQLVEDRGITLVVICPEMSEMRGLPNAATDSFVRLYEDGRLPSWLDDVSLLGSPLKVFSVRPQSGVEPQFVAKLERKLGRNQPVSLAKIVR